jgi:hypothetical protein
MDAPPHHRQPRPNQPSLVCRGVVEGP